MMADTGRSPRCLRASASAAAAVSFAVSGSTRIQPVLPFDQRHVRNVVAAHLVNAGHDFEQAVLAIQHRLAPEARVHGRRRVALHEVVRGHVPGVATIGSGDDEGLVVADEAAARVLEVLRVGQRQRLCDLAVVRFGCRRRGRAGSLLTGPGAGTGRWRARGEARGDDQQRDVLRAYPGSHAGPPAVE